MMMRAAEKKTKNANAQIRFKRLLEQVRIGDVGSVKLTSRAGAHGAITCQNNSGRSG